MKIGFLGAGKVAFSLGKYFKENNLELSGYYSRNFSSAMEAGIFTESKAYERLEDLIKYSNIIFITTTDNAVRECYEIISQFNIRDKFIINTSGSLSSKEFSKSRELGAYSYSLHPIYPFSDKFNSYKNLKNCVFTLEGDEEKFNVIKNLVEGLGNKVIVFKGNKSTYHLGCVMASNLTLALISMATEYLNSNEALEILMPLIEANLNSIKEKGFIKSLTGPAVRGDEKTLIKHMTALKEEHLDLYKVLSLQLVSLALEGGGEEETYKNIKAILGGSISEEYSS